MWRRIFASRRDDRSRNHEARPGSITYTPFRAGRRTSGPDLRAPFVDRASGKEYFDAFVDLATALHLAAASIALALRAVPRSEALNKVQANALDKRFFVGNPTDPATTDIYWRNFVVDASEAQESSASAPGAAWTASSGRSRRRRSSRGAPTTKRRGDNKGTGTGYPNGTIVAAYPSISLRREARVQPADG